MITPIHPGMLLRNHYHILRQLGHGGFGRTYLAEDQHRFDELCVLKEFAPQAQGSYALEKSQELFEREAQILYQLRHPQIPRFRELFRETLNDQGYLFVVQDYVKGSTYRELLNQSKSQGTRFSEAEATQLLRQLLPVLDYIHAHGVIHRDISPDNIIRRQADGLPVLIDFGGVKQIQAQVDSELGVSPAHATPATRLGKLGYAPEEQMKMGIVYPHSDLYGLAATLVVLLTAKEPQHLIDSYHLTWNWRGEVNVSPQLGAVLDKMLATRAGDRYQSVQDVLNALEQSPILPFVPTQPPPEIEVRSPVAVTQPPPVETVATPPGSFGPTPPSKTISPNKPTTGWNLSSSWGTLLLVMISVVLMGSLGWAGGLYWKNRISDSPERGFMAMNELQRQEELRDRRRVLGIDYLFFVELVNEEFYTRYPGQRGRRLSEDSADAAWRKRWDKIAYDFLKKLANLSDQSRQKLGRYTRTDIERWTREVNQLNLSTRALEDIADAQFFHIFPEQPRNQNLIELPIGQVWQAITTDQLQLIKSGKTLEKVQFDFGESRQKIQGGLEPGSGKAYIAQFERGQNLRVSLQVPSKSTFLSIYTPGRFNKVKALLEDSRRLSWSGRLDDSGYYEIVIVSDASEPFNYELILETEE